eukprot:754978-Hanusia_phi.AAC.1
MKETNLCQRVRAAQQSSMFFPSSCPILPPPSFLQYLNVSEENTPSKKFLAEHQPRVQANSSTSGIRRVCMNSPSYQDFPSSVHHCDFTRLSPTSQPEDTSEDARHHVRS